MTFSPAGIRDIPEKRVFIVILLFTLLAGGLVTQVYADPVEFHSTETTISILTPHSDQSIPVIWEDKIVFQDNRNGTMDLRLYVITDGTEEKVNGHSHVRDGVPPSISGNLVVWESIENSEKNIWLYNLTSKERIILANITGPDMSFPYISGCMVIFTGPGEGTDSDLQILDLGSGQVQALVNPEYDDIDPEISGNSMIWQGIHNLQGESDIFLCEIGNATVLDLTQGTSDIFEASPDIDGQFAVWEGYDLYNSTYDIYLCDLSTEEITLLTPDTPFTDETSPSISGDRVAWQRINETTWVSEIVLYSIGTGELVVISQGDHGEQYRPSLYGDRLVWQEMDPVQGTFDVHMATLGIDIPPLVPLLDANVTQGPVPLSVQFSDISTGEPGSWWWDFGDGEVSAAQIPLHVYSATGTYSVTLIASNPYRRAGILAEDLITAGDAPVPDFRAECIDGAAPLLTRFYDLSSGSPRNWSWEFGDGSVSSDQNPEHTYSDPGSYNVTLRVENDFGARVLEKEGYITAMPGHSWEITFPMEGIDLDEQGGVQSVFLNTSLLGGLLTDNGTNYLFTPASVHNLFSLSIHSPMGKIFQAATPDILQSEVGTVEIKSIEFRDPSFPEDWAMEGLFQIGRYPFHGMINLIAWPGVTPEDYQKFRRIAMEGNSSDPNWTFNVYGDVPWVGFTARVREENASVTGPATLTFGVNSTWVEQHGWRMRYEVNTTPDKARVYLDSIFIGYSPLLLDDSVPGGVHVIRTEYPGLAPNEMTVNLSHKWESIRIIHLDEQGQGDVLVTSYLGRDELRNLDIYQAISPGGLSTFGLVSTSRAGSPIQIFYLILSKIVSGGTSTSTTTTGSGGGGGGSYGGSGSVSSPAPAPTPVPTEDISFEEIAEMAQAQISGPNEVRETPSPHESITAQGQDTLPANPAPGLPPDPGYTLVRNVAIVFGVILVAAILVLRWRK